MMIRSSDSQRGPLEPHKLGQEEPPCIKMMRSVRDVVELLSLLLIDVFLSGF